MLNQLWILFYQSIDLKIGIKAIYYGFINSRV